MSERIDAALNDCLVAGEGVKIAAWTPRQRALVGIIPIGISIACSVRELVRQGYIPSAKILIRPLIERVATSDYICDDQTAAELWNAGWPQNKRPKLASLLSRLENGHENEWKKFQQFMVDDFNASVHPNPDGDEQYLAKNEVGESVFWLNTVPSAHELADSVCNATAWSAVILASNAKKAFIWKGEN